MTLAVSLADYVLGTIAPHDLPAVALRALTDGHEPLASLRHRLAARLS